MQKPFAGVYSPEELRRMTGSMEQLAGIRPIEYSDGKARGMRAAEVWTGSGLRFTVYLDRGMDIGPAEYQGLPLAWIHPALGTPGQYEPAGFGWLRTFGGGLLTTGGLTFFGHPERDGDEELGLHGRISHVPAQNVRIAAGWQGEDYLLSIEGEVRQAVLFGEDLLLTRRISTRLGAKSLILEDRVCNQGYRPTPLMLLYHCNFGFPLISPDSRLELDAPAPRPRDPAAAAGLPDARSFGPADPNFAEQVFYHTPRPDPSGIVSVTLANPRLGFGATLRYRAAELPALTQWKMLGARDYVCGLEPGTAHVESRAGLRREGRLRVLAPGAELHTWLEIGVA